MVNFDLGNGQIVPPGYKVAIDMHSVHFNPENYPDPKRCDLFRFSKLRSELGGTESKYGFATVDSHVSSSGAFSGGSYSTRTPQVSPIRCR
jgi:cytochrome P450